MSKHRIIPLESSYTATPHLRICEQEGCTAAGEFRAPKNSSSLRDYYWFCLEHVREYNKAWDFYKGMTPEEIEASRVSDITWNRPSWPVGGWRAILENIKYLDGVDPIFKAPPPPCAVSQKIQKALDILGLSLPLTLETLKKQYKKLVKINHPDLNPHDKQAEEKLKSINEAYQLAKKYLGK